MDEKYAFNWKDFGENSGSLLQKVLAEQSFTDVTFVSADEKQLHAHKVILCVSSQFFKSIFTQNPHPHPLIYVNDVNHGIMESIIEFMYTGKTNIDKSNLKQFIDVGAKFKINGLIDELTNNSDGVVEISNDVQEKKICQVVHNEMDDLHVDLADPICDTEIDLPNEQYVDPVFVDDDDTSTLVKTEVDESDMDMMGDSNFQMGILSSKEKKKIYNQSYYQNIEKRFFCEQCDYSARFKANLKTHIASIHDMVTHPCNQCNKLFSQRSALNKHKRHVHEGFKYTCDICEYNSTKKFKVTNHRMTEHNVYD
eukprot:TRINITY_DN16406_c0_g1_i1.p1 TRINITY_DN16406_c0_g1~~TRINITY_DN16406_c0_g1_i1.p1  ORF type:complete len:322 (+),score=59.76 TRINITY_DN16406_c0_g1_i1:39-968(+)